TCRILYPVRRAQCDPTGQSYEIYDQSQGRGRRDPERPTGTVGIVLSTKSQVRVFQQVGVHVAIQRPRTAYAARAAPRFPDSQKRDAMAWIQEPALQLSPLTVREISALTADYPLGGLLLN